MNLQSIVEARKEKKGKKKKKRERDVIKMHSKATVTANLGENVKPKLASTSATLAFSGPRVKLY